MATVTISLPDSLRQFVDAQLDAKGFGNVSEYFRSLLREAQVKEDDIRIEKLLLEGLASGNSVTVDKAFWTALRAEATQLMQTYPAKKKAV